MIITRPTKDFDEELVVDHIISDSIGRYQKELPVGNYSLFLMDEDEVICTLIQCPSECFCNPFIIAADSTTIMDANLDHAVW